jgi:hypothetical protein
VVVEDCLDGVERSVIEAVDHCSVREVGRSRFRGVIECLLGLLKFSGDSRIRVVRVRHTSAPQ